MKSKEGDPFRIASQCPGQDLNLHDVTRCHLKAVRLPIPPPGRLNSPKLYGKTPPCRDHNRAYSNDANFLSRDTNPAMSYRSLRSIGKNIPWL